MVKIRDPECVLRFPLKIPAEDLQGIACLALQAQRQSKFEVRTVRQMQSINAVVSTCELDVRTCRMSKSEDLNDIRAGFFGLPGEERIESSTIVMIECNFHPICIHEP